MSVGLAAALAMTASGQDLGSANKLFGAKKPAAKTSKSTAKAPSKTEKKPAPKPKATAKAAKPSRSKTPVRKPTAAQAKTSPRSETSTGKPAMAAKSKFTEFKDPRPTKIEIIPGKTQPATVTAPPVSDGRYEDLIQAGNDARDERDYTAAERAYKTARSLKPRDARATYGLGNLYGDQERWEEAEAAYRTAIQIDPDNAVAHIALSYVLTQPIPTPDLGDRYEEAEKAARRAIQLAPTNPLAFDQLGVAMELRGLIGSETENAYRQAIRLDPEFAPPYAHLGRLLRRRGLNKESAAAYENAVRRSNDVATMVLVAEVMQSEQRFAESAEMIERALVEDPRNPNALLLLGRALMALNKFEEAERTLRSALSVTASGFTANSLLGTLYTRQGNLDRAEAALIEAERTVSPLERRSLSQQFERLGDGLMKKGGRSAAERSYRKAIALDPENQSLVGKLAKAQKK